MLNKTKFCYIRDWTRQYFLYIEIADPTPKQVGHAIRFMQDSSITEICKDISSMSSGFANER